MGDKQRDASLETRIIATVAYAGLFYGGLTEEEITRRLFGGEAVDRAAVAAVLHGLNGADGPLQLAAGRYFLAGSTAPAQVPPDLQPVRRWARVAAMLPFVRYLGLTGALAKGAADADVDLFVVASSHRGYLVFGLLRTVGALLARWYGLKLCPNYLVEEHRMELAPHDPFTATEFATMIPLYDAGVSEALWFANRGWVWKFCANVPAPESSPARPDAVGSMVKRLGEALGAGLPGNVTNDLIFRLKLIRLKRQLGPGGFVAPNVVVEPGVFKQHHLSHRADILSRFGKKLRELGIDDSWLSLKSEGETG